jgi:hypothetical protein
MFSLLFPRALNGTAVEAKYERGNEAQLERKERKDQPWPQVPRYELFDETQQSWEGWADLSDRPSRREQAADGDKHAHQQVRPRKSTKRNLQRRSSQKASNGEDQKNHLDLMAERGV